MTQPDDHLSDVLRTEEDIRRTFWALLSDWLVRLSRRVLRGDGRGPDLDAVWSMNASWREAVDLTIERAILPAMQRAYRSVMGEEFQLESRPALSAYLAEVRNRMIRTPEEVFDLIAGQVSAGVNEGESIPKLAARIGQTLSATGTDRWENRATTVARTEAIGALNAAKLESFKAYEREWGEQGLMKVWIATDDARTRPSHAAADGQRVPLDQPFRLAREPEDGEGGTFAAQFPGDPTLPADLAINCRCAIALVNPDEQLDYTDRQMRRRR